MVMYVRVAYDPGSTFQQRLHLLTDMELPDGTTDDVAIREVHRQVDSIVCIAVWNGTEWRTIEGSFPY